MREPLEKIVRAFGSWPSPLTTEQMAHQGVQISQPSFDGDDIYWLELRPQQQGRNCLVVQSADGRRQDCFALPWNARSRVHEYGGSSYLVQQQQIYFCHHSDQRIYHCQRPSADSTSTPQPLTPDNGWRYADLQLDIDRQRLLAVAEMPATPYPEAALVAIDLASGTPQILLRGSDFYAYPRLSPDGQALCWIDWQHPNMPWDGSGLWWAPLTANGQLGSPQQVAGGQQTSVSQPQWLDNQRLLFISDQSQWWNLYCAHGPQDNPQIEPIHQNLWPMQAEFAAPMWQLGAYNYAILDPQTLLASYRQEDGWHLAQLHLPAPEADSVQPVSSTPLDLPFCEFAQLHSRASATDTQPHRCILLAASALAARDIFLWQDVPQALTPLHPPLPLLDEDSIARAQALQIPNRGETLHAWFYPPTHAQYRGPDDERPPLITFCHGGPTGVAEASYANKIQFWTSRGFAVIDVNYRGSSGYGRAYRNQLKGQWGEHDVDDVCRAAQYVAEQGWVNPKQLIIRGNSAGGFTVLAAMTFRDVFHAGTSLYGIGDLAQLTLDTHKFESHYCEQLIGPYPEQETLYQARSPIHYDDQISCPILFLQGLQDRIVPPNQAESMVHAMQLNQLPVALVTYPDEGHGFRQADNVSHAFAAEWYFYGQIFGFDVPTPEPPVPIENLPLR